MDNQWLQKFIAAASAVVAFIAFWKYSEGKAADAREDKIKREDAEKVLESVKIKQEVQNEVNNYSSDDAVSSLLD